MKNETAIIVAGLVGLLIGIFIAPLFMGGWGWNHMGRNLMMQGDSNYQNGTDYSVMGNNIDRHFIEQMIPHHQMAVMMATMLLRGTNREEMKTLAQNIIEAQSREIDQMRSWYRSWYGK